MRLLLPPVVLLIVAVSGIAICRAMHVDPHMRAMYSAGAIVMAAAVLSVVPLILVRGAGQYAVSQAGLVGTMVHLMTSIGAGTVVYMKLQPGTPFLWWLSAMYWATLVAVVIVTVKAVKAAPPDKVADQSPAKPATPTADSNN